MSETPSSMIPLGTKAPFFRLNNTITNQSLSLEDCRSDIATVIMFLSNHCPYVKHIRQKLIDAAKEYQSKGIKFVAICSNDAQAYPDDGPKQMEIEAKKYQFSFPYLYDETQEAAKAYHAECTPDFFVFDPNLKCVYRGRFDGATPGNNVPITGKDLTGALEALLSGNPINQDQKPSLGCNIKWKKTT